ncbi:MAG: phosphate ABC transporter permease subunit PstC, partial [Clostridium sp.]
MKKIKFASKAKVQREEKIVKGTLLALGIISILITVGIVMSLIGETLSFFKEVSLVEFLTGTKWTPLFNDAHFGVLPLVAGTLLIVIFASLIAIPIGLGAAIYLSEYAKASVRKVIKPILEILAGIPSIVYGYFAVTTITPMLKSILPDISVFNALSAGIAVGIMIIPMVSSLSEDAMM